MHRREWLAAVACALITFRGRRAAAASGRELPPVTIEQALDRLESLMSREALAVVSAASEDEPVEFERGIRDIMERRWFNPPGVHPPLLAKALASLAGAFDRRKVDPIDRAACLLSSLWRRRKGLPSTRTSSSQFSMSTVTVFRKRLIAIDAPSPLGP